MKALVKSILIEGKPIKSDTHIGGIDPYQKLFAVTEDISNMEEWEEKGEELQPGIRIIKNLYVDPESGKSYRVLGEISPNAIWVEDGKNYEVKKDGTHLSCSKCDTYAITTGTKCSSTKFGSVCGGKVSRVPNPFLVKCENCNTYH